MTKDVAPYAIVGGTPAKEIRKRFDLDTIGQLQALKWWEWPVDEIRRCIPFLTNGNVGELLAVERDW